MKLKEIYFVFTTHDYDTERQYVTQKMYDTDRLSQIIIFMADTLDSFDITCMHLLPCVS